MMSTLEAPQAYAEPIHHTQSSKTLRENVELAMANYFDQLGDQEASDIYGMVISEVEAPLLEAVMRHTRGNQSKAAILLGISRGTLRKKLKQYGIDRVN